MKTKNETTEEKLLYREPMQIVESVSCAGNPALPICPRCNCIIYTKYQSYCDHCGQCLKWTHFYNVKIRNI